MLDKPFGRGDGLRFGLTVGGAFLLLAGILAWRDHEALWPVAAALGGALVLAGLAVPARLGPLFDAWMALARAISRVTTPVVMALLYYGVITPAGLARRTVGRNAIRRRPVDGSYWVPRQDGGARLDMHRQF